VKRWATPLPRTSMKKIMHTKLTAKKPPTNHRTTRIRITILSLTMSTPAL
jgi:hypothetical protein